MLNVYPIRLRFISARLLASVASIFKSMVQKYTAHLRCRIIKSVHPCTLLMANFGKAEISLLFKPAASVPMFKRRCRLNLQVLPKAKHCFWISSTYQNRHGRRWFHAEASLISANWQPKNEQGCSFLGVSPLYFCSHLVSGITIFKSVGCKGISFVAAPRIYALYFQKANGKI